MRYTASLGSRLYGSASYGNLRHPGVTGQAGCYPRSAMKTMIAAAIALLLIAAAAVWAEPAKVEPAQAAPRCLRRPCKTECWAVKVTYRQIISTPGSTPEYETAQAVSGGAWGDVAGARCWADQVSRDGFWLHEDGATEDGFTPTSGPQKIPASAIDFLMVLERSF